jgi:AAA domain
MDEVDPLQGFSWDRAGDEFALWSYQFPDFRCVVDHFHDSHGVVSAEFMFTRFNGADLYGPARLNLMAPRPRADLAQMLTSRDEGVPWRVLLDHAVALVIREWRREAMPVLVVPKLLGTLPFTLGPVLPKDMPVVIYGDGGVGKSLAMAAMALSVSTGQVVLPGTIPCGAGAVLYCDYEEDETVFGDRIARLMAGAGIAQSGPLHYLEMRRPIQDNVPWLRTQISRLDVRLVVIDSFLPATMGEPESSEAAMGLFRALRALGRVTCAVITHVSKASMLARGTRAPYGSVCVRNAARMAWDVRAVNADEGPTTVGFWLAKANHLRSLPPLGFSIAVTDASIRFTQASVPKTPDLLTPTSAASQIIAYIREHRLVTNREIAQATGLNEHSVDRTCRRLQDRKMIDQLPRPEGTPRTTPLQWFWTGSDQDAPIQEDTE